MTNKESPWCAYKIFKRTVEKDGKIGILEEIWKEDVKSQDPKNVWKLIKSEWTEKLDLNCNPNPPSDHKP